MAKQLASIFGTEEDRVNCPFFLKVGACRNGDQCSRQHNRPTSSQTILLSHMYAATQESLSISRELEWTDEMYDRAQAHLEAFYEEVFQEMANFGEIEDLVVVDNISDHMVGNVYIRYYNEQDAESALEKLCGRYYGGSLLQAEFSPVSDFREARCRQFHESSCNRGGYCNFMHIKHIPRAIKARLVRFMYEEHPDFLDREKKSRRRKRSRSRDRERKRQRERGGDDLYNDNGDDTYGGGGSQWYGASDPYGGGGRRDRDRERERDRGRGQTRGYGGGESYGGAPGGAPKRSESEERRAMIASWNDA